MRLAGSASWRVETDDSQLCDFALAVRDGAGLPNAPEIPPLAPLAASLPLALTVDERTAATGQWDRWWRAIVEHEFRERDDRVPTRERLRHWLAERALVFDPPDFGTLSGSPALQRAARDLFTLRTRPDLDGRQRGVRADHSRAPLDWALMRQTAEDVAVELDVPIGRLRARIAIVPVGGTWWRRMAPGAVLCSPGAASDPATARVMLRDAFESGVSREG